ncbi:aldo/keto reductase [Cellulomonas chengniuliangii]|uniref:Aldo/keto reductase n=1 Tax=Cellulomonas chengniuliangii TaxID=2968084 RepID=A0ABY5KVL7_9CELL|nr:aldo/keto reductase [Cellulomonas chengniuliangii]MCC2310037.1 aldo/keto reductase [Cellulomonas chengniuliangii]MCC2316979.1 aldo/keto reductase [Cellulomonas chengniuliangii]UUI74567.1 aldo/keto reductase [Cellulomonas chengniuliangii]
MTSLPTLALRGADIPLLGLGTWQSEGDDARRAVRDALALGYRHVDTATGYGNESLVGQGLADSGIPRQDVFLTTKLPPDAAGRERETLERSLADLGVDQVDLWLVHWPPAGAATPSTWEQFIQLRDEGLTRAIGVSNYSIAQIDELVAATGEAPAINQIPWSPGDHDPDLVAAHQERGVALEGYSPFKRTDLEDPVLVEIAAAHDATPRQVVLRWHIEHQVVVIPKSTHRDRIAANFEITGFALTPDEVARIDSLTRVTDAEARS